MDLYTPRQALLSLIQAGWTEARIAAACSTSQSTIHRVKSGTQKTVSFELGTALLELAGATLPVRQR